MIQCRSKMAAASVNAWRGMTGLSHCNNSLQVWQMSFWILSHSNTTALRIDNKQLCGTSSCDYTRDPPHPKSLSYASDSGSLKWRAREQCSRRI